MLTFEYKLRGNQSQYQIIDEMIRTGQFVRNKCLRYWMDATREDKVNGYALNKYCTILAKNPESPWVKKLNSMARQAMAERAWSSISRFYDNWKKQIPGKKGYPKFKKFSRSIEYKTTGWKVSEDRKTIDFKDKFKAGKFKLIGSRDLHFYQLSQIKRVRIVKRADGYYVQFCLKQERYEDTTPTGKQIGVDVGLNHYYTDSDGNQIENPRFLRKSEKAIKKLQRRLSRKYKKGQPQSGRYHKNRRRLARKHLKVSRQRKDHAVKLARCVIQSNAPLAAREAHLVAYEDLKVRNMVKNHKLAKSINDASWSLFREWLEYFARIFDREVVAVPPHYTSQNCSNCGQKVEKTLSTRTHKCPDCGTVLDRDHNAAINILAKAHSYRRADGN